MHDFQNETNYIMSQVGAAQTKNFIDMRQAINQKDEPDNHEAKLRDVKTDQKKTIFFGAASCCIAIHFYVKKYIGK